METNRKYACTARRTSLVRFDAGRLAPYSSHRMGALSAWRGARI
jgi:hypothetical protein